tara:strand:- start:491 stop:616 length:126 start_codon:yes stop_codon:yes gene_type:complete
MTLISSSVTKLYRKYEQVFEEFEYEECSEDQSIMRDQEINK